MTKSPFPGMDPFLEQYWGDVHSRFVTERTIEIIDRNSGNRVVTAIELLSPANKCKGTGRDAYLRKQLEYVDGGVNLVAIDFIRQGTFVVAIPEILVPRHCRTPYIICIRRANRRSEAAIIRVPLQEVLPNIAIPLRPTDADIVLQLQPLLDECYRRGRYTSLDYSRSLSPPLNSDDQIWANDLLQQISRQ